MSTFSFSSFLLKEESERNWTERAKRRKGFARCAQIRQYRICLPPQGAGVVVRSHVRVRDFSKTEGLSGSALLCEIFRFRLRMLSFRQQGIFHCGANKTSFFTYFMRRLTSFLLVSLGDPTPFSKGLGNFRRFFLPSFFFAPVSAKEKAGDGM